MANNPWFIKSIRPQTARIRLFCLPCAGGGASFYRTWQSTLSSEIEVVPVCLPGREQRLGEPAIDTIEHMITTLKNAILPLLDIPYAFFGYSMGAIIAHHLACQLAHDGSPSPAHVFIAALRSPDLPLCRSPFHSLPSDKLWQEIAKYGGTPQEILESDEFRSLLEPSLRADFRLAETTLSGHLKPLDCPITVFGGTTDPSPRPEELDGWRHATNRPVEINTYQGGHFFVKAHENALLRVIASALAQ
jgi:surfactin synthase thioesterase subunit